MVSISDQDVQAADQKQIPAVNHTDAFFTQGQHIYGVALFLMERDGLDGLIKSLAENINEINKLS